MACGKPMDMKELEYQIWGVKSLPKEKRAESKAFTPRKKLGEQEYTIPVLAYLCIECRALLGVYPYPAGTNGVYCSNCGLFNKLALVKNEEEGKNENRTVPNL